MAKTAKKVEYEDLSGMTQKGRASSGDAQEVKLSDVRTHGFNFRYAYTEPLGHRRKDNEAFAGEFSQRAREATQDGCPRVHVRGAMLLKALQNVASGFGENTVRLIFLRGLLHVAPWTGDLLRISPDDLDSALKQKCGDAELVGAEYQRLLNAYSEAFLPVDELPRAS